MSTRARHMNGGGYSTTRSWSNTDSSSISWTQRRPHHNQLFFVHFCNDAVEGIIAEMDKEQLVASLQHMALQWKTLQGDASGPELSGRYQGDRRTSQPTVEVPPADVPTLTPRARRHIARERADSPPPPILEVGTLAPKLEPSTPCVETAVPKIPDDTRRKPAAKLERYGGQGARWSPF